MNEEAKSVLLKIAINESLNKDVWNDLTDADFLEVGFLIDEKFLTQEVWTNEDGDHVDTYASEKGLDYLYRFSGWSPEKEL